VVCVKCGAAVSSAAAESVQDASNREWLVTLLLCWFLGVFGIHRFYTGHTGIGVVQLLTLGGCGIWVLIDFIMIIIGSFKDANGRPLKR
jgi:TM2 domain-containing membrane protein YozV